MTAWALTLFTVTTLFAADERQLALVLRAQSDFDRVELSATPQVREASACVQSQAGLLPVTAPEELALIHYRKGYCTLAGAASSNDQSEYLAAAAEFDQAIDSWPLRFRNRGKKRPPEPVSSSLRVLAAIARLRAGMDDQACARAQVEISAAVQSAACVSTIMPADFCRDVLAAGRQWQGWMALRAGDLDKAAAEFTDFAASGWPAWVAGRKAFDSGNYAGTVVQYNQAIQAWKPIWQAPGPTFLKALGPRPDMASALTERGGAELLAGETKSAIATLEEAIKADPSDARAIFLRGRARELGGQKEQALGDYNMASRTAFANAKDLASGEAHLYRGIMLYRRRDFGRAEEEFSSALNFKIPTEARSDAVAWRYLAAVAGGACVTGRESLARSLAAVSPYFPKEEARAMAASCSAAGTPNSISRDSAK
jgi:tetratricopeptide (TPR) repeat protein